MKKKTGNYASAKFLIHLFIISTFFLVACSINNKISVDIKYLHKLPLQISQIENSRTEDEKEIRLYFGYNYPVDKKLTRIAKIVVTGDTYSDTYMMLNKLQQKAKLLDADAVIEIRNKNSSEQEVTDIDSLFDNQNQNDEKSKKVLVGVMVKYGK